MTISDFLSQHKIGENDFAAMIGVSQAAVNRYKRGRIPQPDVMRRIIDATSGLVQPNDFFSETNTTEAA